MDKSCWGQLSVSVEGNGSCKWDLVMIIQKVYSRRKSFLNGMHVIWLDAAELYGENGVSLCLFISPGIDGPARLCISSSIPSGGPDVSLSLPPISVCPGYDIANRAYHNSQTTSKTSKALRFHKVVSSQFLVVWCVRLDCNVNISEQRPLTSIPNILNRSRRTSETYCRFISYFIVQLLMSPLDLEDRLMSSSSTTSLTIWIEMPVWRVHHWSLAFLVAARAVDEFVGINIISEDQNVIGFDIFLVVRNWGQKLRSEGWGQKAEVSHLYELRDIDCEENQERRAIILT